MAQAPFTLTRDAHGRLVLRADDGREHTGVLPVRAFPLSDAQHGLSLVGSDGHELAWVDDPAALPEAVRALIDAELAARDFAPEIRRLVAVSTFSSPSTWTVDTDRGRCDLVLKGEEDIRRLRDGALLITDAQGIDYRVADRFALDRTSRRLLERFL
jgi:hypothetical protein